MNTGVLLKKTGESLYSIIRRFGIANHGSFKTTEEFRDALLLEECLDKQTFINNQGVSIVEVAMRFITAKTIQIKTGTERSNDRVNLKYRPSRHCSKCTELGYHSDLFDLPWVLKCPYHQTPLETKCVTCNNELPNLNTLLTSKCQTCGVQISVTHVIRLHRNIGLNDYEVFKGLENIIKVYGCEYPRSYFVDRNQAQFKRKHVNANSSFYPSIVDNKKSSLSLNKLFIGKNVHRMEIQNHHYKTLNRNIDSHINSDFNIKLDLIAKINHRIKRTLFQNSNMCTRSSCFEDKQLNESDPCLSCKVYLIWNSLIPFPLRDNIFGEPIQKHALNIIHEFRDKLGLPELELPEIVRFINIDYCVENPLNLPISMTKKIFEIDLWTTFLHIYHTLLHIEKKFNVEQSPTNKKRENILSFNFRCSPCFSPYYISKTENKWILNYPKILNKNIVNNKIIKLLSL